MSEDWVSGGGDAVRMARRSQRAPSNDDKCPKARGTTKHAALPGATEHSAAATVSASDTKVAGSPAAAAGTKATVVVATSFSFSDGQRLVWLPPMLALLSKYDTIVATRGFPQLAASKAPPSSLQPAEEPPAAQKLVAEARERRALPEPLSIERRLDKVEAKLVRQSGGSWAAASASKPGHNDSAGLSKGLMPISPKPSLKAAHKEPAPSEGPPWPKVEGEALETVKQRSGSESVSPLLQSDGIDAASDWRRTRVASCASAAASVAVMAFACSSAVADTCAAGAAEAQANSISTPTRGVGVAESASRGASRRGTGPRASPPGGNTTEVPRQISARPNGELLNAGDGERSAASPPPRGAAARCVAAPGDDTHGAAERCVAARSIAARGVSTRGVAERGAAARSVAARGVAARGGEVLAPWLEAERRSA